MEVQEQINAYIAGQPEPKRGEIEELHRLMLDIAPGSRLWFDDGKDASGKTVTNPAIGYGFQVMKYATGKTREFFRIGISGTKTGISVYILGLKDKAYLAQTFGEDLGKAKVTGYCISFKTLKDINVATLESAMKFGIELPVD